jgi:hypothetical protein
VQSCKCNRLCCVACWHATSAITPYRALVCMSTHYLAVHVAAQTLRRSIVSGSQSRAATPISSRAVQCRAICIRPPAHSSMGIASRPVVPDMCCSTITGARNIPSRRLYDGTKTADCVNMCARRHLNCTDALPVDTWGAQLHWYQKRWRCTADAQSEFGTCMQLPLQATKLKRMACDCTCANMRPPEIAHHRPPSRATQQPIPQQQTPALLTLLQGGALRPD